MYKFQRDDCLRMVGTLDAIQERLSTREPPQEKYHAESQTAEGRQHATRINEAKHIIEFLINELDKHALRRDVISGWKSTDADKSA